MKILMAFGIRFLLSCNRIRNVGAVDGHCWSLDDFTYNDLNPDFAVISARRKSWRTAKESGSYRKIVVDHHLSPATIEVELDKVDAP